MNKMEKSGVLLSGEDLVLRGKVANECSLPEVGLKEVTPSGTWLEEKQVQSALEERKYLLEAERIDKTGSLSHAVWRDELKLAEVTQQVGGHWQYLGHHVDKTLYLAPEEALYLMETNCLLLRHNGVTVSLQKAYSLLLDEDFNLTQYKVYASLSRVGYKVFRHGTLQAKPEETRTVNSSNTVSAETSKTNRDEIRPDSDKADRNPNTSKDSAELHSLKDKNESLKETNVSETSMPIDSDASILTENSENPTKNVSTASQETNSIGNKTNDMPKTEISMAFDVNIPMTSNINIPTSSALINDLTVALYVPKQDLSTLLVIDPKLPIPLHDSSYYLNPVSVETEKILETKKTQETKTNVAAKEETNNEPVATSQMKVDENDNKNTSQFIGENLIRTEIFSSKAKFSIDEHNVIRILNESVPVETATEPCESKLPRYPSGTKDSEDSDASLPTHIQNYYKTKLEKIINRKIPLSNPESIKEKFKSIPDLCSKHTATITSPNEVFLPRNVYLNQTSYVLDIDKVKNLNRRTSTPSTNATDRRISVSSESETPQIPDLPPNPMPAERYDPRYPNYFNTNHLRFQQFPRPFYRPYNWRPYRYQVFNTPFQRFNYFPGTAYPYLHRPNINYIDMARAPQNPNQYQSRSETQTKNNYLNIIKELAGRMRDMQNPPADCLNSLHSVVSTYNKKFDIKIRVTRNFNIIEDTPAPSTAIIELEDDEPKTKKPRVEKYGKYLELVKKLAARLKNLERKNQTSSKQKRALSNLIKNFNVAYNCDFYVNSKGELIDRKIVVLDSSSDSDVAISSDAINNKKKRRKTLLPNPFNILKRRRTNDHPRPSQEYDNEVNHMLIDDTPANESNLVDNSEQVILVENDSKDGLLKYFEKNWLPSDDDFGRPIPCSKSEARSILIDSHEIYDFLLGANQEIQNWQDLKLKFWTHLEYCSEVAKKSRTYYETADSVKPLISQVPENVPTDNVWEFLRIIPNNTDAIDSSLRIHFDVYNRDVQHFKKTKPPKPHFRIVCVEESSVFPSGAEVKGLHSRYENTSIVFAVVGTGSISYLQVNPKTSIPCLSDSDINGETESYRQRKRHRATNTKRF